MTEKNERAVYAWNRKWTREDFSEMKEWAVLELHLEKNHRQELLKEIAHIHFSRLQTLLLQANIIDSIECVPTVSTPHLHTLSIDTNRVAQVKSVRKTHWPQLRTLSLSQNHILDGRSFASGNWPGLEWLQIENGQSDTIQLIDLGFLLKLSTDSLRNITMARQRMSTAPFQNNLKRKYKQIRFNLL